MVHVDVYEAGATLSELIDRVELGEEVVIARAGRPVAKLVGLPGQLPPRTPGLWKGKISGLEHFDELDAEIEESFNAPDPYIDGMHI